MANKFLRALLGGLAGGAQGVSQEYLRQQDLGEQRKREAVEALRFKQQMDLNQARFDEDKRQGQVAEFRTATQDAERGAEKRKVNTLGEMLQFGQKGVLPEDLVNRAKAAGLRVNSAGPGPAQAPSLKEFNLGMGMDLEGTQAPMTITAPSVNLSGLQYTRGVKSEPEMELDAKRTEMDEFIRPALQTALEAAKAAGNSVLVGRYTQLLGGDSANLGADAYLTDAQRTAEAEAQTARETKKGVTIARARPPADPLVAVKDPNDPTKAILVPRSQAAGLEPAARPTASGSGGGTPSDQEKNVSLLGEVLDVLKDVSPQSRGFGSAVGAGWQSLPLMDEPPAGTPGATFKSRFDRFQSLQVLPRLSVMKGLGQMSNIEFNTVKAASTDLSMNLEEKEYARLYPQVVQAIEKAYNRARAGTTVLNDPDGQGVPSAPQRGRGAGPNGAGAGPGGGTATLAAGTTRVVNGVTYTWDGKGWKQ